MSITNKSYARFLGHMRFKRGDILGAWEMFGRYDDLVLLEIARGTKKARRK